MYVALSSSQVSIGILQLSKQPWLYRSRRQHSLAQEATVFDRHWVMTSCRYSFPLLFLSPFLYLFSFCTLYVVMETKAGEKKKFHPEAVVGVFIFYVLDGAFISLTSNFSNKSISPVQIIGWTFPIQLETILRIFLLNYVLRTRAFKTF